MTSPAQLNPTMLVPDADTHQLKKQLHREINCLEMQLDRLKRRNDLYDRATLKTYQEMIASRKEMLSDI